MKKLLLSALAMGAGASLALAAGIQVPVDVSGLQFWDPVGDVNNVVLNVNIAAALGLPNGTPCTMTGIGWDVEINAPSPSWISEARFYFDDNIAPDFVGLFLTPGVGNNAPGVGRFASPVLKLQPNGIPDIPLPNGILRIELFDSFDDFPNAVDDFCGPNSFLIVQAVPEPASIGLLVLGGLALLRRR